MVGYGFLLPATVEVADDGHEGWEIETGGGNTADKGQGFGGRPMSGKGSMPFIAQITGQGIEDNLGMGEGHLAPERANLRPHNVERLGSECWAAQTGKASSRDASCSLSLRFSPTLMAKARAELAARRRIDGLGSFKDSEMAVTLRNMRP